jgi:acyl-CoA synthetase (AMP-forming)/AMP-acid ligase II
VTTASLASLLIHHPFLDDEPLLHSPDESFTAGEARMEAFVIADRLRDAGVERGHAVAVQMPNGPHVITTMIGVWLAGAVFVPVNPRAPEPEVVRVLDATQPFVFVRTIEGDAPRGTAAAAGTNARKYEPDVAFVTWTSGTTGAPKPILHTHASYFELLDRVLAPLRGNGSEPRPDAKPPSPNLIPVSLALNAGIYNALFGLRAGAALVVMDGFDTATFAELVARFAIRSTVLPPAAITMLADDPAITDLAPLRYVRSITAPLSPLQARRFMDRFGVVVLNSYGQAEIGEVIGWTAADAREHPEKLGALGRAHPGVALKIVDDDGVPAAGGESGRLLVRPPSMAAGDAAGDGFGARLDAEGYLDTGDLARVDADGFVWIEGRAGDLINRGGNKVVPDQVEEVLRLVPGVADAAVVGVPDARLGEVPVAFIVETVGVAVTDAELQAVCREHLAPYKVPVAFHRIDALPRSEVGKVLRRELVERL